MKMKKYERLDTFWFSREILTFDIWWHRLDRNCPMLQVSWSQQTSIGRIGENLVNAVVRRNNSITIGKDFIKECDVCVYSHTKSSVLILTKNVDFVRKKAILQKIEKRKKGVNEIQENVEEDEEPDSQALWIEVTFWSNSIVEQKSIACHWIYL